MWMAAVQILFGVPALVYGLKSRGKPAEGQAPIGGMFLLSATFKLLSDAVPLHVLLPLIAIPFVLCCVWFVRTARASAVRLRDLKNKHARS